MRDSRLMRATFVTSNHLHPMATQRTTVYSSTLVRKDAQHYITDIQGLVDQLTGARLAVYDIVGWALGLAWEHRDELVGKTLAEVEEARLARYVKLRDEHGLHK